MVPKQKGDSVPLIDSPFAVLWEVLPSAFGGRSYPPPWFPRAYDTGTHLLACFFFFPFFPKSSLHNCTGARWPHAYTLPSLIKWKHYHLKTALSGASCWLIQKKQCSTCFFSPRNCKSFPPPFGPVDLALHSRFKGKKGTNLSLHLFLFMETLVTRASVVWAAYQRSAH